MLWKNYVRGLLAKCMLIFTILIFFRFPLINAQQKSLEKRAAKLGLKFIKDIPLAGGTTRLDYQSIDESKRMLYIAHLGSDMVTVFNIDSLKVVKNIPGISRPHGILAVPELNRVYVSATGRDEIDVIDENSLAVIAKVPAGDYPDGIAFDPKSKRIFVSDENGNTVSVIDALKNSLIKKIEIGGQVGNSHYDTVTGLIYSADQTNNRLVAIDPGKMEITARYNLQSCKGAHGFYIDAETGYAFITGEDNASYVVFDLTNKKNIAKGNVGEGPDVLAFDKEFHLLYVSTESGIVSVFKMEKGNIAKTGETLLAPNAHTVSIDQKTHLVFFPLQNIDGRPVLHVMKINN